ncbi:hypothetical protein [Cellulomonas xiejunii]|uniref:hypothetical protein n=1 Tax=Cellulomonas xiejunii TaxID=2968083 RepID=UPI001D0E3A45|nr:hypothetical protein [Cellulomonas xiejunii]MCC2315282.1 hypothetical protein [Cellulomonas xiejunii]
MTSDPWQGATTIPALPCEDVDELADFWTALGFDVTYRQLRPNPFVAVRRGSVELQYFGRPGLAPQDSYSTCVVLVDDTVPVFEALAAGLRARYGRLPLDGFPRVTRPRRRANAWRRTGFTLIDPAGNGVRFMRRPAAAQADGTSPATTGERPTDPLARALDDATVHADSHDDPHQAHRILAGALRRAGDASEADRVHALAFLAELAVRTGDPDAARGWLAELEDASAGLDETVAREVVDALAHADELRRDVEGE